ncbi:glycosyltransferase [Brachybacterium halotolerans subsp. kimchii]|uniref:CgeB family protein n=1 Tax=Brachybacterium halotolerans TaxID=2795215 RepID=UPI001E59809D|nr:glycosyltransferase [Brachybacterium halotolerans]UEJ81137.1 glycosyltransferase [Brachybacterium halotolerans subsp. kimchii]
MTASPGTPVTAGAPRAPRLLLVSPAFHGYWHSIASAFARDGNDVTVHRYDAYDTLGDKTRLKATVELPERLAVGPLRPAGSARRRAETARLTDRAIAALRETRPDRVVIIKGDGLDERFWDALGATPRILWLYDDLHRHEYTPDFLRQVGPVVEYARSEAEMLRARGVDAHFVPNAFDPHRASDTGARRPEIAFIGAGYENRRRILTGLAAQGLPVRAWGRDFSRHPLDRARTFSWSRPPLEASREVPLERAYQIHAESAAEVAVHGLQNGHAMRTFEIPGMGGVQLVDREDVAEFYDVGTEVALWHDEDELAELCRRALSDPAWARGLREAGRRRTLAEHTFDHRIREVDALWD